jgi:hypothetical protein
LNVKIVAAEPDLRRYFRDIGNAIFSKGECGRTGIVMPALALESRCTEMTAQCQEKAKSMAAAQRRWLLAVFRCSCSLFLAVIFRWCLSKTQGFCGRGLPPGCIFAGFTAISATPARCSAGYVKRERKPV